jgi:DNA-binding GntR family transcriptional regulator
VSPQSDANALHDALSPLERPARSLAAQASDALRDLILRGLLTPGQRLNEVELAAALGISRAPLREGMQRLTSEGLLTIVSADELLDLYELRIALETHAARAAAERAGAEQLSELSRLLDTTEAMLTDSGAAGYPEDLDFHEQLVRLPGNDRLVDAAIAVHQQIQLARLRSGHLPDRARDALDEHRQVVECLGRRDGDGAARLLKQHLESSLANALRLFDHADRN